VGLYAAHRNSTNAQLGPAIFLKMASYVAAGLRLPQLTNISGSTPAQSASSDTVIQLVAEAYMASAGIWLGQMSAADLADLAKRLVAAGLPQDQWRWIADLIPTFK